MPCLASPLGDEDGDAKYGHGLGQYDDWMMRCIRNPKIVPRSIASEIDLGIGYDADVLSKAVVYH